MTARCPSDLALEAYLLEPKRSPLLPHVDACERCRARVARMGEEGEEFRRFVFPATVDAIEEAAAPRRRRLAFVLGPIGAFATLTAALLVFVRMQGPAGPPADYVGLRGNGVGFTAFVKDGDGARALEDGSAVPASAALRFEVSPRGDCFLWIMSVDAKGEISRIYPPKGAPVEKRAPGAIPGGAVLDGQPGPERLFAVCAPETMAWGDVRRAAERAARDAEAVRGSSALGEPLAGAAQSTLLLEKRP